VSDEADSALEQHREDTSTEALQHEARDLVRKHQQRAWLRRLAIGVLAALAFVGVLVVLSPTIGRTPVATSPSTQLTAATQPSPTSTQASSPSVPPGRAGAWTELRWSGPTLVPDQGVFSSAVAWREGYVAIGSASGAGQRVGAAFASTDGVRWQRTTPESTFSEIPTYMVATSTRLITLANRMGMPASVDAWVSLDGRGWQQEPDLALAGAIVSQVAVHDGVILALGTDASGRAATWRSDDGGRWIHTLASPAGVVLGIAAVSDGFLALGRDGAPDVGSGGVGLPGVGRPAAWWSSDGRAWSAAQVEGIAAAGAQLTEAFRVEDGYFAVGSDTTTPGQNARSPLLWISTDGRDWRILGPPAQWGRAGANGRQALIFSRTDSGTVKLGAWSSQDGRDWIHLNFTGDVVHMPGYEPAVGQTSWVDRIFVMSRGIVVLGQADGQLTAWFAEAVAK
jgi:hypothetical protein